MTTCPDLILCVVNSGRHLMAIHPSVTPSDFAGETLTSDGTAHKLTPLDMRINISVLTAVSVKLILLLYSSPCPVFKLH